MINKSNIAEYIYFLYQERKNETPPITLITLWNNLENEKIDIELNNLYKHWKLDSEKILAYENSFIEKKAKSLIPQVNENKYTKIWKLIFKLKKIFSISGRINRTNFILTILIFYISVLLLSYIGNNVIKIISFLLLLWIKIAQGFKREHDLGFNGFFQFIPARFIWLMILKGENKINKYGKPT